MFVSCAVFVLSGRGLCLGLITSPEESYRVWCVSECDGKALIMRGPWPTGGRCDMGGKNACFSLGVEGVVILKSLLEVDYENLHQIHLVQ
jgi:coenzyme F420-reducing hydrogenase gamma subunit